MVEAAVAEEGGESRLYTPVHTGCPPLLSNIFYFIINILYR